MTQEPTNKDESGQMEVCTALSRNFEKSINQSSQCSFLVLTSLTPLKSRDQFIAEEGAFVCGCCALCHYFQSRGVPFCVTGFP